MRLGTRPAMVADRSSSSGLPQRGPDHRTRRGAFNRSLPQPRNPARYPKHLGAAVGKGNSAPGVPLIYAARGEQSGTQSLRLSWIPGGAYGHTTEDVTAVAEAKVRRVRSRVKVSGKRVPSSRKGQAPQSSDESPRLVSVDSHQVRTQMSDGRCSPTVVLLCCRAGHRRTIESWR